MRSLVLAATLAFFALIALAGTTAEPQTKATRATATLPDADPVIVTMDTKPPFSTHHRGGLMSEPRPVTEI